MCVCTLIISDDKVWMMLMNDLPAQTAVNSPSDPEQGTVLNLGYNVSTEQVLPPPPLCSEAYSKIKSR